MEKIAPPRNNMASSLLYKGSKVDRLIGRDPDYHYEYFLEGDDEESMRHPGHLDRKLRAHEIQAGDGMYATVEAGAWEVVNSQTDRGIKPAEKRQDQGARVDGTIRQGRQVLCRIHKDKYRAYQEAESSRLTSRARGLKLSQSGDLTSVVSDDENVNALRLLAQAGAPVIT